MGASGSGNADLSDLVQESHLLAPDDVPRLVAERAQRVGARDAALYLVDYEQRVLAPVPAPDGFPREPVLIDSTLAGRCYRTLDIQQTSGEATDVRLWAPVVDGVERLGVLEFTFDGSEHAPDLPVVRRFASLVAEVVMSKKAYGDLFERVRRRRPMTVAAELAWNLLPPLTFGTDRVVISGVLAPAYELGGDTFDYAVDARSARVAVFDAMGHGLEAGLLASVAVAACRTSRRAGVDLVGTSAAIDGAIDAQFGPDRFVTALLAELELASGRFSWTVSGHPPPLLLRGGKKVKVLRGETTPPLGIGGAVPVVAEETLEPADQVLFFTDGVVEARSAEGEFFGIDRLVDLIGRTWSAETPAPETMRRLSHAILDHQEGELQDDATIVVVEWKGPASAALGV